MRVWKHKIFERNTTCLNSSIAKVAKVPTMRSKNIIPRRIIFSARIRLQPWVRLMGFKYCKSSSLMQRSLFLTWLEDYTLQAFFHIKTWDELIYCSDASRSVCEYFKVIPTKQYIIFQIHPKSEETGRKGFNLFNLEKVWSCP